MHDESLSKRQLEVMDDLFAGEDESQILTKYKLSRTVYNKWLSDEAFCMEFDRRIEWLNRQSQVLIARYSSVAAAKLVQLTESEKAETARKACLDIISLPRQREVKDVKGPEDTTSQYKISERTASRLLEVLAQRQAEEEG